MNKRKFLFLLILIGAFTLLVAWKWSDHQHKIAINEERIEQERIQIENEIRALEKARVEEEARIKEEARLKEENRLKEEARKKEEDLKKETALKREETQKMIAVEEAYFKDALFIGDSRTEGFQIQSGITGSTFLTYKGLNVTTARTKPLINRNGKKLTILEAAQSGTYSKIYVMLGVNELGWASDKKFIEEYGKLIDGLKEAHPDATIYIQSIIYVSKEKSDKDKIYNNKNVNRYNKLIQQMVEDKKLQYLNVNEVLATTAGDLIAEASFDGVHLKPDYCKIWYQYLKAHGVQGGDEQ